jgi:hypothetical protein
MTNLGVAHEVRFGTKRIDLTLRGMPGSPLVVHNFSEKAKQEIRDKQQKKAKKAKPDRDPHGEFLANRYVDAQGRECAPMTAVKKALVSAGTAMDNLTKVGIRQALFCYAPDDPTQVLFPIERHDGSPAVGVMQEDAVTIGINTRGLAYRSGYAEWQIRVRVEYNPRLISEAQILELAAAAGWGVGLCEGRPEKSSALGWGRFIVADHKAVDD